MTNLADQTTSDDTNNFRDDNSALFRRRSELQADLEAFEGDDSVAARRRLRLLRREIDSVTSAIVSSNMGLVRSYTRRFGGSAKSDERADFESAGLLGLMRAVDSYDPECGTFGQWAFKPIQREVLRAVRATDHPNLSLGDFEKRPAILRAQRDLTAVDADYRPSDEEIASAAGVTVAQVRRVLAPPRLESMSQRVHDETDTELADTIESPDSSPEEVVISKTTLAALQEHGLTALDPRELYVLVRRYGLDGEPVEKLTEIGETLALSRESVRQIESKALAKLQHPLVMHKLSRRNPAAPQFAASR
jgi:RNA polymerase primary sigma factor/RNA polymerase nonessential primary-like sigma factor